MGWLWNTISQLACQLVRQVLPPQPAAVRRRKRIVHVRFSPSTLHRQLAQQVEKLASTNPFFNFLLMYSMQQHSLDLEVDGLSFREVAHGSYTARGLWLKMDEEQRAPYVAMAQRVRGRNANGFDDKRTLDNLENRIRLEAFRKVFIYDDNLRKLKLQQQQQQQRPTKPHQLTEVFKRKEESRAS